MIYYRFSHEYDYFFCPPTVLGSSDSTEAEKHLELGKQMVILAKDLFFWFLELTVSVNLQMARGQLQDALTHFHAALEKDPHNYLTLYRRATVYLAQGRARAALEDLNKALEIQPDFVQARSQKGNILMKLGRLDEAHIELDKVVSLIAHSSFLPRCISHNLLPTLT